jgi:hypothetical protein
MKPLIKTPVPARKKKKKKKSPYFKPVFTSNFSQAPVAHTCNPTNPTQEAEIRRIEV